MPATDDTLKKLAVAIIAFSLLQGCAAQKEESAAPKSSPDSKQQVGEQAVPPDVDMAEETAAETTPPETVPKIVPKTVPKIVPKTASGRLVRPKALKAEPLPSALPGPELIPPDTSALPPRHTAARTSGATGEEANAGTTAGDPAITKDKPGYTTVKVFYGTDRAAEDEGPWTKLGAVPWGYLTIAALVFSILMLIVIAVKKKRFAIILFLLGAVATTGLFFCMMLISRNTKPQETHLERTYGNARGTLEMGTCEVSIPQEHKVGELERPSVFKFEFNEDPTRHVVLLAIEPQASDKFFAELKSDVSQSAERQAFVFVHGFNVTFEGAALRTAQLKYDLDFDGPAIFYSWPSQGDLLGYIHDEASVGWTVPHLEEFITDISKKTGAKQVHLIAHSMGNRALTSALKLLSLKLKPTELPMFNEVLLTAPDIDADVFRNDIAPAIVKTAKRVTLYASSNDGALVVSKKIHGYPRAGESGENVVVVPGIDTIDVSGIDTSLLGHTYYGDNDTVITDIVQLLHDSKPPSLRDRLRAAASNGHKYWVFGVDENASP